VTYALLALVAVALAFRPWRRRRRPSRAGARSPLARSPLARLRNLGGVVGLVAAREVRERTRSRVFRIGTLVVVLVVAAAVVIPVLRRGRHKQERVGVVGGLSDPLRTSIIAAGGAAGVHLVLVPEATLASAEAAIRSGQLSLVIVDARQLVVKRAISDTDTSTGAPVVRAIASDLSLHGGLEAAGIPPAEAARLAHPAALPVISLEPARHDQTTRITALYGLILLFVLLSQYGTWILIGVVEEKSSRVVEVLLSAMRPGQLLAGMVIGIGTVALAQGALLLAVALGLAEAVGSDLVRGTAPVEVLCVLAWLVLGYAFYCWVYAAGGSLAERQEHVQTLAFPLQLPILVGYIASLTALGSTNPSTFNRVLAYLPPTAPFAMPVLVALGKVTWWGFTLSALLTVAATVGVAKLAATVYRRAILRTGRRVRLRDVLVDSE
jgi:ABC-2 type transport system permease protein